MPSYTTNGHATKVETGQAQKESALNETDEINDSLAAGYTARSVAGSSNVTLTAAQARARVIELTGTLTGNIYVDLPSAATVGSARALIVYNNTGGAFNLDFGYNGGTRVRIQQGYAQQVYHNGTNLYAVGNPFVPQTNITGPPVTAPAVHVTHNAAQSITNDLSTTLAFNTERFDTNAQHDTVTNNSRLTCVSAGRYLIGAAIEFAANAAGDRNVSIILNGTTPIAADMDAAATLVTRVSVQVLYVLAVGDYLEAQAYQNSGGSLNVNSASAYTPNFWMVKVS